MSLTALATSFADQYVNVPKRAKEAAEESGGAVPQGPPPAGSGAAGAAAAAGGSASGDSAVSDNLKALVDYIPSEIITLYIAAIAAIQGWTFVTASGSKPDELKDHYSLALLICCLIAAPLWVFIGVYLASKGPLNWRAFAWPMIAAPVAFFTYALAIPNSWIQLTIPNGGLYATILLLIVTPVLHTLTMLYTKLFPPPTPSSV
jgi:hypothetical protein